MFGPVYFKAVLVASVIKIMQIFSGASAINLYSTSIFTVEDDELSPIRGTLYVGLANLLAVFIFTAIIDCNL